MTDIEFIAWPKTPRLFRDIVVSEKIDGTNAAIIVTEDGRVGAQSRRRIITPDNDNYGFARWVHEKSEQLAELLGPGYHYGEWWGCLAAETSVKMADGALRKIGQIVNNKESAEVMSYNFDTGEMEPRRVVGWSRGPRTDEWLSVKTKRVGRGGRGASVHLTPNHVVYVSRGGTIDEIEAGKLEVGDTLLRPGGSISAVQDEVLRGTILGDGSIGGHSLSFGHSNHAYSDSKIRILGEAISNVRHTVSGKGSDMRCATTRSLPAVREIEEEIYTEGVKAPTRDYILSLGPIALAVWYMDDGCLNRQDARRSCSTIYTNGFPDESTSEVSKALSDRGYENYTVTAPGGLAVKLTPDGTERLHADIAPYVTPEMRYKILPEFAGVPAFWDGYNPPPVANGLVGSEITEITDEYSKGDRSKCRYDIEVEGNNNFIANGILVHNSKIQRGYGLTGGEKRFSLFDTHRHEGIEGRLGGLLRTVPVLYQGPFDELAIHLALDHLRAEGSQAEPGYENPEGIVTFHAASNSVFKTLLENDDLPKGAVA